MTLTILAIDPGNTESAYAFINHETCKPLWIDKVPNETLRLAISTKALGNADRIAIEMIASYGMPVGAEVFETCVWIGRFLQSARRPDSVALVKRQPVKLHHCHSSKAKDSNVSQALVDRFAAGQPNRGKGTKAEPGWFYGFRADIWQAYALGVLIADTTPSTVSVATSTPATDTATLYQQGAPF